MKEIIIKLLGGIPKKEEGKICGKCLGIFSQGKTINMIQAVHLYSDEIKVEERFFCNKDAPQFDVVINWIGNDGSVSVEDKRTILLKRTGENCYPTLKVFSIASKDNRV